MYISHDAHVDQPAEWCRRELLEAPEGWLPGSVTPAGEGRRFLVRVGFPAPAGRISKGVELTIGAPAVEGQWLVVPVAWRATGPGPLFPVMDGKLTVRPLGPRSARLTLSGTYEPPMGALGQQLDEVALHQVAEATVRDLVERIAERISELAAHRPA
jgi:hypothetical protein